MIRRSTWVILIVFLLLLGGFFIFNRRKEQTAAQQPTPTAAGQTVFGALVEQIQGMSLQDNQGRRMEISRKNEIWSLVEPAAVDATDVERAAALATRLAELRTTSQLEQQPDIQAMGLDKPVLIARVTLNDGTQRALYLGDTTPTGNGVYALLPSGQAAVLDQLTLDGLKSYLDNPPVLVTPTVGLTPLAPDLLVTPAP